MMPCIVYLLCTMTSTACAVLLWRGYRRSHARLLMWSAWCFVGLALNNVLLVVDMLVLPSVDLGLVRDLSSFAAMSVLLIGLVWSSHD